MFKGNITTDTSVSANTNVPFTVVRNTNSNTAYDSVNNAVLFNNSGYYDIMATIVATVTTSDVVSCQLYVDGVAVEGAVSTETLGDNVASTFTLVDNEKIIPSLESTKANVSVRFDTNVTVNDAILIVETRK